MANKISIYLKKYIKFIPFYLIGSGAAFTVDLIIFTFLRTSLGINLSAIIAFFFGTITTFVVLSIVLQYRLKKKRLGILIQLFIGFGTLLINIIILNLIDFILLKIDVVFYKNILNESHYYALVTKTISSSIGFLWTSSLTGKYLFKQKEKLKY